MGARMARLLPQQVDPVKVRVISLPAARNPGALLAHGFSAANGALTRHCFV